MPRPLRSLHDVTARTILEAAGRVIARDGDTATMNDVAVAAGVGRATLYRYFRTREQLVEALWGQAIAELAERVEAARLDEVPFAEGLGRLVRAIATVGERYDPGAFLLRRFSPSQRTQADAALQAPLLALIERGQQEGALRSDLTARHLGELFGGIVIAGLGYGFEAQLGLEDASAAVVETFLRGARPDPSP